MSQRRGKFEEQQTSKTRFRDQSRSTFGSSTQVNHRDRHTHLLILSQTLLGLGELVTLSLLGHSIFIVGSHVGQW